MGDRANGGETWIARRLGDGYEGPYSDLHEFHAAEFGLMTGATFALLQVAPELGAFAAAVTGTASARDLQRDGLPRFVRLNKSYAVLHAVLSYLVVSGVAPAVV